MPAWEALRDQPRGFVLTADFWNAALYARQPVTWFDLDTTFQSNILQNLDHFRSYIASTPIRYIVLPHDERAIPAYMQSPAARLYDRLPLGRALGWNLPQPTAPEVRAFLEQHFPKQSAGAVDIFVLDRAIDHRPFDTAQGRPSTTDHKLVVRRPSSVVGTSNEYVPTFTIAASKVVYPLHVDVSCTVD